MTRPTRQLEGCMAACIVMKEIWEGKENTRELQNKFGKKLEELQRKASGVQRKDSGGYRTWKAYPIVFGLCYEDENKILRFTDAGNIVAKGGREAREIMVKQILNFQYPNLYHDHDAAKMEDIFSIFPYRFLVKLLLKLKYLTIQEIALFVLQTRTNKELERVSRNILTFRNSKRKIKPDYNKHKKLFHPKYKGDRYDEYLRDLAGTFKNHLEFLPGIESERIEGEHRLHIERDAVEIWKEKLIEMNSWRPKPVDIFSGQNKKFFYDKYGILPGRKKAQKKSSPALTKMQVSVREIKEAVVKIIEKEKKIPSHKQLVEMIEDHTLKSSKQINQVLSRHPEILKVEGIFEKKYLSVAGDGKKWQEFEEMTTKIFKDMGFPSKSQKKIKLSNNKGFLDNYFVFNNTAGLSDCKAHNEKYDCNNKDVGVMKDYIKKAQKLGNRLVFFGYVYGRKFSNTDNFDRIIKESRVNGFRISAMNLLILSKRVKQGEISKEETWKLFQSNNEIDNL